MVRQRQMRTRSSGISGRCFGALAVFLVLAPCPIQYARAQQQDPALGEFIDEIRAGLEQRDVVARANAIMGLYHFEGADEEVRSRQQRILDNLFKGSAVTFREVAPLAELPEYVADGVRYGPNLAPSGNVVFDVTPAGAARPYGIPFTTTIPFGRSDDGRYRFIAMVKRAVTVGAPKDSWLTIMLSGMSDSGGQLTFSGACTLQQSDGTARSIEIDDEGLPSHSVGWRGIGITDCLIEKSGGRGTLRLQLMRDDVTFFDEAFEDDLPAIFPPR